MSTDLIREQIASGLFSELMVKHKNTGWAIAQVLKSVCKCEAQVTELESDKDNRFSFGVVHCGGLKVVVLKYRNNKLVSVDLEWREASQ